jgi:hypothetical protein
MKPAAALAFLALGLLAAGAASQTAPAHGSKATGDGFYKPITSNGAWSYYKLRDWAPGDGRTPPARETPYCRHESARKEEN